MTPLFKTTSLVLGVHPNSKGFGWVAFDGPFKVHAFASYKAPKTKNEGCLRRLEYLLKRFQPSTVVLEAYEGAVVRSDRIRGLCRLMVALAAEHGAELAVYTRGQVAERISEAGAQSRDGIAAAVARHLPALQSHLPPPRKPWMTEDYRLAVFAAAALVLTHYHNGATALLDDLRDAA